MELRTEGYTVNLKLVWTLKPNKITNHKLKKMKQVTENEAILSVLHALLHVSLVLWIKMATTVVSHVLIAVFVIALLMSRLTFTFHEKVEEVMLLIQNIEKIIHNSWSQTA